MNIQKYIENLIPQDKALHLIGGVLGQMIGIATLSILGVTDMLVAIIATTIAIQAPIFIKEFYDQQLKIKYNRASGFSWRDILFGEIGALFVSVFTIIISK